MTWLLVAPFLIAIIGANTYFYRAYRNLSPSGEERRLRILLRSTLFAGRDNFTDVGWRYRNRALLCLAVWPLALLVLLFMR